MRTSFPTCFMWLALVVGASGCARLESDKDVRISVQGADEVETGRSVRLTATTANGIVERYRWQSTDDGVATVDRAGKVTGRRAGRVRISAIGTLTHQTATHRMSVIEPDLPGLPDAGPAFDAGRTDAGQDAGDAGAPDAGGDTGLGDAGDADASDASGDAGGPAFADEAHAILIAHCMACHVAGGVASGTDYVLVDDAELDRAAVLDLIDRAKPDASPLLVKARGDGNHGGGVVLTSTSTEYEALRDWIAAGALP